MFLKTLCWLMTYLKKPYKKLWLVYQSTIAYEENCLHHYKRHCMIILGLHQLPFFVSGFIYSALKLIDLRLQYFIESIYTNAKINLWNKSTYFTVPCEKSRKACLTYEDQSCVWGTILVKLICCMTFGPASGFCCLIRSLAISLSFSFKYE